MNEITRLIGAKRKEERNGATIRNGVKRNFGTRRLTDLQVFLVHRIVLIPREAPETAFLPAGGQKRVVSTVVIDHVRVPATKT